MAEGMGDMDYREARRGAVLNLIKEKLEVSDMRRVYRIMYGYDKVDKSTFWKMEEAREGAGRRRFREKELSRTLAL